MGWRLLTLCERGFGLKEGSRLRLFCCARVTVRRVRRGIPKDADGEGEGDGDDDSEQV